MAQGDGKLAESARISKTGPDAARAAHCSKRPNAARARNGKMVKDGNQAGRGLGGGRPDRVVVPYQVSMQLEFLLCISDVWTPPRAAGNIILEVMLAIRARHNALGDAA